MKRARSAISTLTLVHRELCRWASPTPCDEQLRYHAGPVARELAPATAPIYLTPPVTTVGAGFPPQTACPPARPFSPGRAAFQRGELACLRRRPASRHIST